MKFLLYEALCHDQDFLAMLHVKGCISYYAIFTNIGLCNQQNLACQFRLIYHGDMFHTDMVVTWPILFIESDIAF